MYKIVLRRASAHNAFQSRNSLKVFSILDIMAIVSDGQKLTKKLPTNSLNKFF